MLALAALFRLDNPQLAAVGMNRITELRIFDLGKKACVNI